MGLVSVLAKYKLVLALLVLTAVSTWVYLQVSRRSLSSQEAEHESARGRVIVDNTLRAKVQYLQQHLHSVGVPGHVTRGTEHRQLSITSSNELQKQMDTIWNQSNNQNNQEANHSVSHITLQRPPKPSSEDLVPNVVHFVRYTGVQRSLDFTEFVSIKSAYKLQKPHAIYLHCDYPPTGQHWIDLLTEGQIQVNVMQKTRPIKIGGYDIDSLTLAADVKKLEILKEFGGIAMETDVVLIQSLDPLRKYNFTIGQQKDPLLSLGVILANKNSKFLDILITNLKNIPLKRLKLDIGATAFKIYTKHLDLLHVEQETLTTPDLHERHLIFSDSDIFRYWKSKLYVVHFRFQPNEAAVYNSEYIKTLKNLIGRVLRYIYYGSADLIDKNLPHILYATKAT